MATGGEILKAFKSDRKAVRERAPHRPSVERPYGDFSMMNARRDALKRKAHVDRIRARKAEQAGLSRGAN